MGKREAIAKIIYTTVRDSGDPQEYTFDWEGLPQYCKDFWLMTTDQILALLEQPTGQPVCDRCYGNDPGCSACQPVEPAKSETENSRRLREVHKDRPFTLNYGNSTKTFNSEPAPEIKLPACSVFPTNMDLTLFTKNEIGLANKYAEWHFEAQAEANRQHKELLDKATAELRAENKKLFNYLLEIGSVLSTWKPGQDGISVLPLAARLEIADLKAQLANLPGLIVEFLKDNANYKLQQRRSCGRFFENVCHEAEWATFTKLLSESIIAGKEGK